MLKVLREQEQEQEQLAWAQPVLEWSQLELEKPLQEQASLQRLAQEQKEQLAQARQPGRWWHRYRC